MSSRLVNSASMASAERRMRPLLGTFVEIGVVDSHNAASAFEHAYAEIADVHRRLSFHERDSELSRLNASRGAFVPLSTLSLRVLRLSRAISTASGGLFNCTVGGALVNRGLLPNHGDDSIVEIGDVTDLEIQGREARLARPVRITLDGIAKGYAVDRAVAALKHQGVRSGWVNAGGDIRAFGAVTVPLSRREPDGFLRWLGGLRNAAVATSVVRHEHDPHFPGAVVDNKGAPASCGTWTVLSSSAWRADALTKVAALAPTAHRTELIARLGGRLITAPAQVH